MVLSILFEARIENLEKSIPPSVPSRNKKMNKKVPIIEMLHPWTIHRMRTQMNNIKAKGFASTMTLAHILQMSVHY